MTTVPNPAETARQAEWLRRSALTEGQIRSFLQSGALFAWSEDRWLIAWGKADKSAHPNPGFPSFYTPDFHLEDPEPWRIYPHTAAISPDGLALQIAPHRQPRTWSAFDGTAFARNFRTVQDAITRGELHKAVPAVFEHSDSPLGISERGQALRALANLPAGLMPYGCWNSEGGVLGASPELLFEDDGSEIHTVAVAGTARAGAAPDELMDDPKERAEHGLVLDDLDARLAALGPVTRGATRLWRIGILSHLRTDLRVSPSRHPTFTELVAQLHPTPAVGIAPRGDWREMTRQIDGEPRGFFAAPFGLTLPGGLSRCLVAIRNVQWDRTVTRCGAGCGLVSGSQLARETAELQLKLAATRGNLGL